MHWPRCNGLLVLLLTALSGPCWPQPADAVGDVRSPAARRMRGGRSTVTGYFRNPKSLCLSYGCGTSSLVFGGGSSDSVGQSCRNCKTVQYNLPQTVRSYCLPATGGGGGRYLTPPGWTVLASASWISADGRVDRDVTVAATAAEWTIHRKLAVAGAQIDVMDFADCKGVEETDDSKAEIMMLAFAGSPPEVSSEKRRRRSHGMIEFEPHIAVDNFKAKTFQAAKQDGFFKGKFRKYKEKVNVFTKTRKRLGTRIAATNFKPNSGFVIGTVTVMDVGELEQAHPDMMFGLQMTCKSKDCDLDNFFGCFHIMCRRATAMDLAMPAVYDELKDKYIEEMEHQLQVQEQLLENDRVKAQEETDLAERKRQQEELDAKHKAAVEFMKRKKARPQHPAFAHLPPGAVPLGAFPLPS